MIRGGYSIFYSGSPYCARSPASMASQPPFANTASLSTSLADPLTLENGFAASRHRRRSPTPTPSIRITNWPTRRPGASRFRTRCRTAVAGGARIYRHQGHRSGRRRSSPIGLCRDLRRSRRSSSCRSPTPPDSIIRPPAPIRSSTPGRRASPAASRAACRPTVLYTYSKSIDDASSFTGTGGTTVAIHQQLEHWSAGFRVSISAKAVDSTYLLSSPVGVHGMMRNGGWKTAALAGWTMSGTFTAASGTPLTATVAGNLSNTGGIGALGGSRARRPPGFPLQAAAIPISILAAFTTPPAGRIRQRRARYHSRPVPDRRSTLPSIALSASAKRRRQLQFRLSATNALNHVVITEFRHHGELRHLRPADRGIGHADGHSAAEVQLLMRTSIHGSLMVAASRCLDAQHARAASNPRSSPRHSAGRRSTFATHSTW